MDNPERQSIEKSKGATWGSVSFRTIISMRGRAVIGAVPIPGATRGEGIVNGLEKAGKVLKLIIFDFGNGHRSGLALNLGGPNE